MEQNRTYQNKAECIRTGRNRTDFSRSEQNVEQQNMNRTQQKRTEQTAEFCSGLHGCVLLQSVVICCILLSSALLRSICFCSSVLCSALYCSVWFCSNPFCSLFLFLTSISALLSSFLLKQTCLSPYTENIQCKFYN